jgi:hypothetical protein
MDPSTLSPETIKICLDDGEGNYNPEACLDDLIIVSTATSTGKTRAILGGYGEWNYIYDTTYWLVVTTGVKDLAGNSLAEEYTASFDMGSAPVGELKVDNIAMNEAKRYATPGGGYDQGWEWYISLTIPTNEPNVWLKFSDFQGPADSIAAAGNIRYYSEQSANAPTEDDAIEVTNANTYPEEVMVFNGGSDTQLFEDGWQVVVKVQVKVPSTALGGAYSAQFSVKSELEAQ